MDESLLDEAATRRHSPVKPSGHNQPIVTSIFSCNISMEAKQVHLPFILLQTGGYNEHHDAQPPRDLMRITTKPAVPEAGRPATQDHRCLFAGN